MKTIGAAVAVVDPSGITALSPFPQIETTDVAIIGNGPSALTLSFLLHGNWPFYTGQHPDEILHARLEWQNSKSILEADFTELCAGISGQSRNIVSNLFDQLLHPTNAYGDISLDSCVSWKPVPRIVSHLVVGMHPPGGAWQQMHGSKKALSFNNWLELPGLPLKEWMARRGFCSRFMDKARLPLAVWKAYYNDYPMQVGIVDNLRTGYHVTSVRNLIKTGIICDEQDADYGWEIKGFRPRLDGESELFVIRAKKVVLATGTAENPKKLHIPGEKRSWTGHTYDDLHNYITANLEDTDLLKTKRCWGRVLIIGSGLTSADSVLSGLTAGCHVYHVFDSKNSILSQLSERLYPEYATIWKLMSGETKHNPSFCGYYTPIPDGKVSKISNDHKISIENFKGVRISLEAIDFVAILIGSGTNLGFLSPDVEQSLPLKTGIPIDARKNPVSIDQMTHESIYQSGLYALGPLCGDNYVRFIPGGAVAAARHLFSVGNCV